MFKPGSRSEPGLPSGPSCSLCCLQQSSWRQPRWHVVRQPLPNQWDDSVYASATFDWLDFIENRGDLLRGVFWGAVYAIPHHLPPLVFITSLAGALLGGETVQAMRLAHIVWFLVLLLSAYGVGKKLSGGWAGALSILLVGTAPLVFFWSKTVMGEPALFASVGLLLLALVWFGQKTGLWGGILHRRGHRAGPAQQAAVPRVGGWTAGAVGPVAGAALGPREGQAQSHPAAFPGGGGGCAGGGWSVLRSQLPGHARVRHPTRLHPAHDGVGVLPPGSLDLRRGAAQPDGLAAAR